MAAQIAFVSPINAPSRGQRVQMGINGLEEVIDGALADGSRLLSDILLAGQEAKILPQVTQRAIERMHECLKAGIEMRSLAISAHHDLRKIQGRIDWAALGWGNSEDCPTGIGDDN
jgi:hypothetical protein